jgi:hypothetical protein
MRKTHVSFEGLEFAMLAVERLASSFGSKGCWVDQQRHRSAWSSRGKAAFELEVELEFWSLGPHSGEVTLPS